MKREVLIENAYEAAFLASRGLAYQVVPQGDGGDTGFAFQTGKQLDEARRMFDDDVDLQEFVEAHRRLEWRAKIDLKISRQAIR